MSRSDANQPGDVAVITDAGNPAARMRSELTAIAANNASFSNATEMAEQAATRMLGAESIDDILAVSERAGLSAEDVLGKTLTLTGVDWAPSAERFKTPFGVFAVVHALDASDEEVVFTSGAGNIVSAIRAFEVGGHFPVGPVRVSKRGTGAGELFYFTR